VSNEIIILRYDLIKKFIKQSQNLIIVFGWLISPNLKNFEDMNMADNEYYLVDFNPARAQETFQMDQISPRITHNQPLVPGHYEDIAYLNDAEIREIRAQQLIRRPRLEQNKSRICCYVLITFFCVFLFSVAAFYICESIFKLQQKHE